MSNESIPDCIVHKDTRNIQVRLDYMLLFRNETKAKVIRIMETWTNQKRAEWFKLQRDNKEATASEPPEEALWVTMSYEEFSTYAYGTMNHDNIKKNVDELVTHEYLQRRPHPTPGLAPQYLLDTKLLQEVLDGQELPSLFDDIGKIRPPRKKHTPPEKYPQGEGINTPRVGGNKPPGTGDFSYPSKNTTKNYRESTNNKDDRSLSLESDAPALIDLAIEKKKRETNPRLPALSVSDSQCLSEDDDIGDAPTEKMRVTKPELHTPDAGAAIPPSTSTTAQARSVSPSSDAAQRSTNGAVQASDHIPDAGNMVIPERPRSRKVTQATDAPVPMPKSDTREIQRRINEHRGYGLEEKGQILQERIAIKSWCNLHTVEDYEQVMRYLKKDSYWGKPENYQRIGGLTLAKETPKALAQIERPPTPINGKFVIDQERNQRNIAALHARAEEKRRAANG